MSDDSSDFGPIQPKEPLKTTINLTEQNKLQQLHQSQLIPGVTKNNVISPCSDLSSSIVSHSEVKSVLFRFSNSKSLNISYFSKIITNQMQLLGFKAEDGQRMKMDALFSNLQSQQIVYSPIIDLLQEFERIAKINLVEAIGYFIHNLQYCTTSGQMTLLQIRVVLNGFCDHILHTEIAEDNKIIVFHQILVIIRIICQAQDDLKDRKKLLLLEQFFDINNQLFPESDDYIQNKQLKRLTNVYHGICKLHNYEDFHEIDSIIKDLLYELAKTIANIEKTIGKNLFKVNKQNKIQVFDYFIFQGQERFFDLDQDITLKQSYFSFNTELSIFVLAFCAFYSLSRNKSPLDGSKQQNGFLNESLLVCLKKQNNILKTYSTQDFRSMIPTTFSSIKRNFENVSAPLEVSDSDHWYESVVKLKAPIIADTDEDIDIMSLCQFDEDLQIQIENNQPDISQLQELFTNDTILVVVLYSMRSLVGINNFAFTTYYHLLIDSYDFLINSSTQQRDVLESSQHIKQIIVPSYEEQIIVFVVSVLKQNSSGFYCYFGQQKLIQNTYLAFVQQIKQPYSILKQTILSFIDSQNIQEDYALLIQIKRQLAQTLTDRKEQSKANIVLLKLFQYLQKHPLRNVKEHQLIFKEELLSLSYELGNNLFSYNEFDVAQEFFCYACAIETQQKVIFDERLNRKRNLNPDRIGEDIGDRLSFLEIVRNMDLASYLFESDSSVSQSLSEKSDIPKYSADLSLLSSRGLDMYLRRVKCYLQIGKLKQAQYIILTLKQLFKTPKINQLVMKFKIQIELCQILLMRTPQTCQAKLQHFLELANDADKYFGQIDNFLVFQTLSILAKFYMRTGHPCEAFLFVLFANEYSSQCKEKYEIESSLLTCSFMQLLAGTNQQYSISQNPIQFPYHVSTQKFAVGQELVAKYLNIARNISDDHQSVSLLNALHPSLSQFQFTLSDKQQFTNLFISSHLRALDALNTNSKLEKRLEIQNQIISFWLLKFFVGGDYKLIINTTLLNSGKIIKDNVVYLGFAQRSNSFNLDMLYISKLFQLILKSVNLIRNIKIRLQLQLNYCQFLIYKRVNLEDIGQLLENSVILFYSHYMAGPLLIPFLLDFLPSELLELKIILNKIITISLQLQPAPSYTPLFIDASLISDFQLKNILTHQLYPEIEHIDEDETTLLTTDKINTLYKNLPYRLLINSSIPLGKKNTEFLKQNSQLYNDFWNTQYTQQVYFNNIALNSMTFSSEKQQRQQLEFQIQQQLLQQQNSLFSEKTPEVGFDKDSMSIYKLVSDIPDYKAFSVFPQIIRHSAQLFFEQNSGQLSSSTNFCNFEIATSDSLVFQFVFNSIDSQQQQDVVPVVNNKLFSKIQYYVQQISNAADTLRTALSNIFKIKLYGDVFSVVKNLYGQQQSFLVDHYNILFLNSIIAVTDYKGNAINLFIDQKWNITTISNIKQDFNLYSITLPLSKETININGKIANCISKIPDNFQQRIFQLIDIQFSGSCRTYQEIDIEITKMSLKNDFHILYKDFQQQDMIFLKKNDRLENLINQKIGKEAAVFAYPNYNDYQKVKLVDVWKSMLVAITLLQNCVGKLDLDNVLSYLFSESTISISLPLQIISWENIYKKNFRRYISQFHMLLDKQQYQQSLDLDHKVFVEGFSIAQHLSAQNFDGNFVFQHLNGSKLYNRNIVLNKTQLKNNYNTQIVKMLNFGTRIFSPLIQQFTHPSEAKGRNISNYELNRKKWLQNFIGSSFSVIVPDMGFVSCLNESDNPIYCEFNGGLVPFHTQLLSYGLSEPNRKSDPITKVIKFIDVSPFIGKQAPNIFNGQLPETRFEQTLKYYYPIFSIMEDQKVKQMLLLKEQMKTIEQDDSLYSTSLMRHRNFQLKCHYVQKFIEIEQVKVFVLQLADLYDMTDALFTNISQKSGYFIFVPGDVVMDVCSLLNTLAEQIKFYKGEVESTKKGEKPLLESGQSHYYELFKDPAIFLQLVCFIIRKQLGVTTILLQ